MLDANFMQELVGYRHEETEVKTEKSARPEVDLKVVTEYRKLQIMNLVFDAIVENGGRDWNHDPIDADTVEVFLDEQRAAENAWLAENWDAIVELVYQRIEREHRQELAERELSVPMIGR